MAHFGSIHDRFVGVVFHLIIDTMQIVVVRKREYKIISSTERADLGTVITLAHGEVRIKYWKFAAQSSIACVNYHKMST